MGSKIIASILALILSSVATGWVNMSFVTGLIVGTVIYYIFYKMILNYLKI